VVSQRKRVPSLCQGIYRKNHERRKPIPDLHCASIPESNLLRDRHAHLGATGKDASPKLAVSRMWSKNYADCGPSPF
jgi:hypothetical protein